MMVNLKTAPMQMQLMRLIDLIDLIVNYCLTDKQGEFDLNYLVFLNC